VDGQLALATFLSLNPTAGDLIPGAGGARKLRWATVDGKGKGGGGRVIHYFVSSLGTVYLIAAYDKSKKANLTQAQVNTISRICKALKGGA